MPIDCEKTSPNTDAIWAEFHKRLLLFIKTKVHDSSLAEDILQDVFVKIHKHVDTIKDEEKIAAWVYQITRNTIVDYYRKRKSIVGSLHASSIPDALEEEGDKSSLSSCIVALTEQLPAKYGEALRLYSVEGHSQSEVAQILGISLSGAKSRIQRGRSQLKLVLQRCCDCVSRSRFDACLDDVKGCNPKQDQVSSIEGPGR